MIKLCIRELSRFKLRDKGMKLKIIRGKNFSNLICIIIHSINNIERFKSKKK